MNIFVVGLAIIVAAWLVQLHKTLINKDRGLSMPFLLLYAIGCCLLAIGNFVDNEVTSGVLNTVCLVLAAGLLVALIVWKK